MNRFLVLDDHYCDVNEHASQKDAKDEAMYLSETNSVLYYVAEIVGVAKPGKIPLPPPAVYTSLKKKKA